MGNEHEGRNKAVDRRFGLKEEEAIARQIGGKLEVGSGSFFKTLDISTVIGGDQFLVEVKSTKGEKFTLSRSLWVRICERAMIRHKKPLLVVVFRLNILRKVPLAVIPASTLPSDVSPDRNIEVKRKTLQLKYSDSEGMTRIRWFYSGGGSEEIVVMHLSRLVNLLER